MACNSKGCPEQPLALSQYCWDHIPDRDAYTASLVKAVNGGTGFSRANLRKVALKAERLEKADFAGANLSQADLSGTHFFDATLDRAELVGANLAGCDLTHCSLKGVDLTHASLKDARLWNAELAGANLIECDLSGADLWNANLYNCKLWRTDFAQARSVTKASFSSAGKFPGNHRIDEAGLLSAEEAYRGLKQYFISNGMYNDASWASFKEKTMERLALKKKGDWLFLPSLVMNVLCGYGEKPYRIVLSALSAICLFALLYGGFGGVERAGAPTYVLRWYDYLYYSAITFTTVGYGDFIPKAAGLFRFMAACEAFCGVFVTGLFIFTLARKYSAR